MKKISEQAEALALDLFQKGLPYERIAEAIGLAPHETRRIIGYILKRSWEFRYPGLAGLPSRAATALVYAGIFTKEDAVLLLRTGKAHICRGVGAKTLPELCAWCGVKLIECQKDGRYWVEGQMDPSDVRSELLDKIETAQRNIATWRTALKKLEARERQSRLPDRDGPAPGLEDPDPECDE